MRWRSDIDTRTAPARSALSPRSPSPSAQIAPAPGCRPRVSSTHASSPRSGTDLRRVLRSDATDDELDAVISGVWTGRTDRYSEIRTSQTVKIGRKVEMSYIGG